MYNSSVAGNAVKSTYSCKGIVIAAWSDASAQSLCKFEVPST